MERKIAGGKRESVAERLERLERHLAIMARMERMLDVVENASGDVQRADEAERRAIEELRPMGIEVGGQKSSNEAALDLKAKGRVVREVKNCTGFARSAR